MFKLLSGAPATYYSQIKEKVQSNQFWSKNCSLSKTNNPPFRAVPTKLIHDWTPSKNILRVFKHLINTSFREVTKNIAIEINCSKSKFRFFYIFFWFKFFTTLALTNPS